MNGNILSLIDLWKCFLKQFSLDLFLKEVNSNCDKIEKAFRSD